MGLDEAIDELSEVDDAEAFASRLQEERSDLYKQIYSDGYGAGKTDIKEGDLQEAKSKLEQLKSERSDLKEQLEELQEDQPEAAELRGKYESKLQDKQAQIESLQEEKQSLQQEKQNAIRQERKRILRERTKNRLVSRGVDPEYADFKTEKAVDERVKFDEDNLQPEVFEDDGVPSPQNGESDADDILADSLMDEVPPKFVSDSRPGSSGLGSTDGAGGRPKKATSEDMQQGAVDPEKVLNGEVDVEL